MVRLPEPLRQRLEYLAARNGRSMNSEIIYALNQYILLAEPSEDREEREAQQSVQERILQELKLMNARLGGTISAVGTTKGNKS
jgi:plasmid stability protein